MSQPPANVPVKIVSTLAVGLIAYLATDALGPGRAPQLTVAILVASVVLLAQFVWDFRRRVDALDGRLADHHLAMSRLVQDGFSKVQIAQLAMNSRFVADRPALFNDIAEAEINRVARFLKELGDGGVVFYDGEDRDWILSLTRCAQYSIDAVSLGIVDLSADGYGGFWATDLGRRYLDHQQKAINERGVRVRRVFILDRDGMAGDPAFQAMCAEHSGLGIEVRVLDLAKVSASTQQLFDTIIFDDVVSYEVTTPATRADRPTFLKTQLALNKEDVQDRVRQYRALWESATPFPQPPPR
ncbi:hypothetical protein [Actinocorallia lasiicapitis]